MRTQPAGSRSIASGSSSEIRPDAPRAFPPVGLRPQIPEKAWQIADPSGLHFVYRPGLVADEGAFPVAYEPGLFGPDRWVLLTDGTLKKMPVDEIHRALARREDPAKKAIVPGNQGSRSR